MKEIESIEIGEQSRYDLSYFSYRQLQRDFIRFERKFAIKFPNGYISRILINYMSYAQDNFCERFEKEVFELFIKKQTTKDYYHDHRLSLTTALANKIQEFDFSACENIKKRTLINYILEHFAALPLADREKIYCYPQYKNIIAAIDKNEVLLIKHINGKEYEVKPFEIAVDDNSFSYYLIGYSRERGSNDNFECYPFKLSRIKECQSRHKEFSLSFNEQSSAKSAYEQFGAAYARNNLSAEKIKDSVVLLTERGYNELFLKNISHHRPIPTKEPEFITENGNTLYQLTFDCSYQQIRNYFFSFGKEAEILFPDSLRNQFISDYQEALGKYLMRSEQTF